MAQALGIKGIRVEKADELQSGLEAGFAHQGPVLIDVQVNRSELILPPSINSSQIKGFSLYLSKAILNGKGTEVVD